MLTRKHHSLKLLLEMLEMCVHFTRTVVRPFNFWVSPLPLPPCTLCRRLSSTRTSQLLWFKPRGLWVEGAERKMDPDNQGNVWWRDCCTQITKGQGKKTYAERRKIPSYIAWNKNTSFQVSLSLHSLTGSLGYFLHHCPTFIKQGDLLSAEMHHGTHI